MNLLDLVLVAATVLAVAMGALWFVQRRTGNASIVDPAWALGTGAAGAWFALAGPGESAERRWLVAIMAIAWFGRLGVHMVRRTLAEGEDGRYRYLRERFGRRTDALHAVFFQVQGSWAILWALPFWAAATATGPLGWREGVAVLVFAVAFVGEALADAQLARFRADPDNAGRVCDGGLWAWSRHPNYFFECLHWVAYAVMAATSPWWWVALAGPPVAWLFITRVTGIPWVEAQALRTRADAYRRYQRTTPSFLPRPPRAAAMLAEPLR